MMLLMSVGVSSYLRILGDGTKPRQYRRSAVLFLNRAAVRQKTSWFHGETRAARMSTARRIKAEYAEKAKIRSKKSGFCAVKRKMRFRQSASELAVHDNALGQYRTIKLRCFAEILRPDFVALSCNTSSIAAKTRLIRTQNLLANHSCSIMRHCPWKKPCSPLAPALLQQVLYYV